MKNTISSVFPQESHREKANKYELKTKISQYTWKEGIAIASHH
jgi:hypothetical protein